MPINYPDAQKVQTIIDNAQTIVILQADNPDGDSLGSSLALEHILSDMGKKVHLYCAVDIPGYLRYLPGWDRVDKDLPAKFDAGIIVDASTMTLFEKLEQSQQKGWLAAKPVVVLDHHRQVSNDITFADVTINDPDRSSAGELIFHIAKQQNWKMSVEAMECLMTCILGDTQGLSNSMAKAETYRVMAELVDAGVDRPTLEETRRAFTKMPEDIFRYKGELIKRTELELDGKLALVEIPQAEINQYSPIYNPAPLIQNDLLQVLDVGVAVVLKHYDNGRITAAIRCNPGYTIAAELAEHFGGGGHAYAAGFKIVGGKSFQQVKSECITKTAELISNLKLEK